MATGVGVTRRLLLTSLKVGGGHTALRDSFAQALRRSDPECVRFDLTLHESCDPFSVELYTWFVRHAPGLQGLQYALTSKERLVRILSKNMRALAAEAKELLSGRTYDAVICTHFLFTQALVRARTELGLPTRIITAIPDYGLPTTGFFPRSERIRPDHVIVMDERCRDHLAAKRDLTEAELHLSGFLTREPFRRTAARPREGVVAELIASHPSLGGYDRAKPTFIFLGGSAWTEKTLPVIDLLFEDAGFMAAANVIVVSGANPSFESRMREKAKPHHNVAVFGLVPPELMAKLIAIGDYPVLGSLAPASMQELLELRCGPFLLFSHIPGSETAHVPYIREHRIGLYEPNAKRMAGVVRQVAGLEPRAEALQSLIEGFAAQAKSIRDSNVERALRLPQFLEQVFHTAPAYGAGALGAGSEILSESIPTSAAK